MPVLYQWSIVELLTGSTPTQRSKQKSVPTIVGTDLIFYLLSPSSFLDSDANRFMTKL